MKRGLFTALAIVAAVAFCMGTAFGADIELAKKSHLQKILERGELRVGFESGYMPFEMTDKKGDFVGFEREDVVHLLFDFRQVDVGGCYSFANQNAEDKHPEQSNEETKTPAGEG